MLFRSTWLRTVSQRSLAVSFAARSRGEIASKGQNLCCHTDIVKYLARFHARNKTPYDCVASSTRLYSSLGQPEKQFLGSVLSVEVGVLSQFRSPHDRINHYCSSAAWQCRHSTLTLTSLLSQCSVLCSLSLFVPCFLHFTHWY